jgi:hypothetical protein
MIMNLERLDELETIDPSPLSPWRAEPFTEIALAIIVYHSAS